MRLTVLDSARKAITILLLLLTTACDQNYAPVISARSSALNNHQVNPGETLYAIAWRYDMDYRTLAAINHLSPPYRLEVGQQLHLKPYTHRTLSYTKPQMVVRHATYKKTAPIVTTRRKEANVSIPVVAGWYWPTKGKLIGRYSPANGNKGIDIAGSMGTPIHAAAAGRVAYSGNGLRGYGNLIIIKHNDEYLSAYAHNNKNLVKEGQLVTAGQVIATMGNSEAQTVMLHFEIRKAGKSINPLLYVK